MIFLQMNYLPLVHVKYISYGLLQISDTRVRTWAIQKYAEYKLYKNYSTHSLAGEWKTDSLQMLDAYVYNILIVECAVER